MIRLVQLMLKSFLVGLPKESRLMQMKSVTCNLKLGYLLATVLSREMLQVRLNSEIVLFHGRCEEQSCIETIILSWISCNLFSFCNRVIPNTLLFLVMMVELVQVRGQVSSMRVYHGNLASQKPTKPLYWTIFAGELSYKLMDRFEQDVMWWLVPCLVLMNLVSLLLLSLPWVALWWENVIWTPALLV